MNFYEGKTVWIIGGTSGIGLAIAGNLCKISACKVVVSGRSIEKIPFENVEKIALDVTNRQSFANVFDEILQKHQKIDIIFFCVGAYEPMNIGNFSHENASKVLNTNLGSMVHFVENLPKIYGKCSQIGIISSVAGYFGMPNSLFYGASKAGLSHLTQSLQIELSRQKIDVKLINPGFVKTQLTAKNSFKMPFIISPEKASEIILKNMQKNKFEIAFPWNFVLILKIIKALPNKIRVKILKKIL